MFQYSGADKRVTAAEGKDRCGQEAARKDRDGSTWKRKEKEKRVEKLWRRVKGGAG